MGVGSLTHARIWRAIDRLAESRGMSPSGLARSVGLAATSFNPSKRRDSRGRARWPTTQTLARVFEAAETSSLDVFLESGDGGVGSGRRVPLIGLAQAGEGGFFDDAGFPVGGSWDEIDVPGTSDENVYALEVSGSSMEPLYREGDVLVVSPHAGVRRGDRVVVKTVDGEVMVKTLRKRTLRAVELESLNSDFPTAFLSPSDVRWIARVLWASQ